MANAWTSFVNDSKQEGVFTTAIDRYLRYNMTDAGMVIHWAAITSGSLLNQLADHTVNRNRGYLSDLTTENISFSLADSDSYSFLNQLYSMFKDPNIEGIPIKTASIECEREVQISEYGVIMESGQYNKQITDNASPSPRVWNISGYLTSCWDIDIGLVSKPSLLTQEKFLDAFAKSRRPLWFMTDENEFVTVQIASLKFHRKPENMNACEIETQLKEFVPLESLSKATKFRKAVFAFTH